MPAIWPDVFREVRGETAILERRVSHRLPTIAAIPTRYHIICDITTIDICWGGLVFDVLSDSSRLAIGFVVEIRLQEGRGCRWEVRDGTILITSQLDSSAIQSFRHPEIMRTSAHIDSASSSRTSQPQPVRVTRACHQNIPASLL